MFALPALGLVLLGSVPASAADFAGPYVDVVAGWNRADGAATPRDGFAYGGGGGYDLRFGRVVAGVLAEASDVTGSDCDRIDYPAGSGYPDVRGRTCSRQGRTIVAGVRAGYVVGDRSLVYLTASYANVRTSSRFDGTIGGGPVRYRGSYTDDGIRAGAGIEREIARHAFIKAEYRYTAVGHDLAFGQHQLVTGVGYRF